MLTETPKVDVERARKLLLDLAAGLQSVAEGQPQKSWLPLAAAVEGAVNLNGWFTPEQVKFSLKAWVKALQPEALDAWLTGLPAKSTDSPITVGIVMAGNIPFVGLHDLICGVVSGHRIQIKPSRDDAGLIAALLSCWSEGAPGVQEQVTIAEAALSGYDAVIATGSRNSGRYFQHYFGKVPHIIRGQRTSVAVLDGSETHEDMCALAEDIFRYFGLGCRNVTQVFVPRDFRPGPAVRRICGLGTNGPTQQILQQLHVPQGALAHGGCGLAGKRVCPAQRGRRLGVAGRGVALPALRCADRGRSSASRRAQATSNAV